MRHSCVSVLFAEGRTVIEAARQGAVASDALATYAHVIEELRARSVGQPKM